ncbi:MAG: hypothetical protein FD123_3668 [Bacteroidetes bacterium]|nr:MAG: hypothetical protein FD123_3668 [Bacteroidota bacterium]
MKKILTIAAVILSGSAAWAFCGFYVAKADAKLFNKTSQVILVRDGEKSTITMSSDFQGDVKDFAMVIPVPVVLKKEDIRISDRALFDKIDAYSAPRMVEYYDNDPCYREPEYSRDYDMVPMMAESVAMDAMETKSVGYQVKIEAKYTVGEYDILILSAKESGGLERWLTDNGYKIPSGAKEVLDPYIKSNLKFFVVKVNLGELAKTGNKDLRPIQISFNSPKFMLPIRLGMANASGPQDMIVYAFTKSGRVEVTNYRTVEIPSNKNVPLFVQEKFGQFYKDLYTRAWKREGKSVAFLEYSWDVSGYVTQFCDPCVGNPPMLNDFMSAGVDWVQQYHYGYQGNVYFTRLHVTYDRATFPQDLQFQETPNKEQFQARYVITHPASGSFDCKEANTYLIDLQKRRQQEISNMVALAGWDAAAHVSYQSEYNKYIKKTGTKKTKQGGFFAWNMDESPDFTVILLSLLSLSLVFFALTRRPVPVNK